MSNCITISPSRRNFNVFFKIEQQAGYTSRNAHNRAQNRTHDRMRYPDSSRRPLGSFTNAICCSASGTSCRRSALTVSKSAPGMRACFYKIPVTDALVVANVCETCDCEQSSSRAKYASVSVSPSRARIQRSISAISRRTLSCQFCMKIPPCPCMIQENELCRLI